MMRAVLALVMALTAGSALADTRNLPVLAVTLYPGDAIDAQSVVFKAFTGNATIWKNYVTDRDSLSGMHAKHTLVAGAPIALTAIKLPDLVKRGVETRAVFSGAGLEITSLLMPLESGTAGDIIQARNPDSGLSLRATVMPDGSLRVGEP